MLDSLTYSADGLLLLAFIIFGVIFFLNGPHKVYESLIGALIGVGGYLLTYELTFIHPDTTRTLFLGNWMIDHRGIILWCMKLLIAILYIMTPMTIGVNVSGEVRGTAWFLLKTFLLTVFFIAFGSSLVSLLGAHTGLFSGAMILSEPIDSYSYFRDAQIFGFFHSHATMILFAGFILGIYKILISHWSGKLLLIGGVIYAKGTHVFGKRTFDTQVISPEDSGDDHDDRGDEHH